MLTGCGRECGRLVGNERGVLDGTWEKPEIRGKPAAGSTPVLFIEGEIIRERRLWKAEADAPAQERPEQPDGFVDGVVLTLYYPRSDEVRSFLILHEGDSLVLADPLAAIRAGVARTALPAAFLRRGPVPALGQSFPELRELLGRDSPPSPKRP